MKFTKKFKDKNEVLQEICKKYKKDFPNNAYLSSRSAYNVMKKGIINPNITKISYEIFPGLSYPGKGEICEGKNVVLVTLNDGWTGVFSYVLFKEF